MKRFLVILAVLALGFACSQKEQEAPSTQQEETAAQTESEQPRQAIPEQKPVLAGTPTLKPYFDEMGTLVEKSVAPGESFDLYIVVTCGEKDQVTAAEYKLNLPEGISIIREFDTDSLTMKSGKPEEDLMLAFKCSTGPKIFLSRYVCEAAGTFTGGSITTEKGEVSNFIGVVDCGPDPVQIPAENGAAVLKVK